MAETLSSVLERYEQRRGQWGATDCLCFALEAARAVGRPDRSGLLPRYGTRIGAARALTRLGCRTLAEALDSKLTRIPAALARPGDIAWQENGRLGACGVVVGAEAVFFGDDGFVRLPVRSLPVWRVV